MPGSGVSAPQPGGTFDGAARASARACGDTRGPWRPANGALAGGRRPPGHVDGIGRPGRGGLQESGSPAGSSGLRRRHRFVVRRGSFPRCRPRSPPRTRSALASAGCRDSRLGGPSRPGLPGPCRPEQPEPRRRGWKTPVDDWARFRGMAPKEKERPNLTVREVLSSANRVNPLPEKKRFQEAASPGPRRDRGVSGEPDQRERGAEDGGDRLVTGTADGTCRVSRSELGHGHVPADSMRLFRPGLHQGRLVEGARRGRSSC